MKLTEVRAIVTGGASGLGAAVVAQLAAAGAHVCILDQRDASAATRSSAHEHHARALAVDVTDEHAVEHAVLEAETLLGGLNVAVNCAGIGTAARLVGRDGPMPAAFMRHMLDVNLLGTALIARSAALRMRQNPANADGERGVIVMTASIAAFDGQVGQVAYAASKGGIAAMTLPMAREFASSGIRVMTIAPGLFDTPLLAGLPDEARASLGRQTPFPARLGRPAEFAQLVAHVLENVMLNGETIRLDGALRMAPR